MSEIETLRALSDAATPGPWVVFDDERPGIDSAAQPPDDRNILYCGRFSGGGFGGVGRAEDAAFIVAAVNYVRAALAKTPDPATGLCEHLIPAAECRIVGCRGALPGADWTDPKG